MLPKVKTFIEKNSELLDYPYELLEKWLSYNNEKYATEDLLEILHTIDVPLTLNCIPNDIRFDLLKTLFNKKADEYLETKSIKVVSQKSRYVIRFKNYVGSTTWIKIPETNMSPYLETMNKQVESVTQICDKFSWDYILDEVEFKVEKN